MQTVNEIALSRSVWYSPLKDWQKSLSGWIIALFAVSFAVFVVSQISGWGEPKQISLISDGFQAIFSIASFLMAWRVVRHRSADKMMRRAWLVLSLSYFSYCFGHTLWFYYSSVLEIEPFPSVADVGFLGMYPLMLIALLMFPNEKSSSNERLKFGLDTAIVMLGGTTVVWHFIIQPTIANIGEDWLTPVLNLSYTVGDMILMLGVTTVLLRKLDVKNRIALFIIIFGILNMFVADLGFAYLTLQSTYYSGHWIDNFFISSMLLFMIASHYQYRHLTISETLGNSENSVFEPVRAFSYLPYFAVAVGFAMLLNETQDYWNKPFGYLVFVVFGLTALVVVRQIAAVKENVRLQTEKIERENELRFSSFVKDSFDAITVCDFQGNLVYHSPSFTRILGYEDGEFAEDKNFELYHPEDAEEMREAFAIFATKPDSILTKQYRLKHKNGQYRTMEAVGKLFDDRHGLRGVVLNARDITERKAAENRLLAYNKKLQISNRELQDFAFVASHDLQEPLRKVQAFGDRLKSKCADSLSDDGRDYLERMQNAASRMQTLINDLLSFSRVTTKAQPFVKIDLGKIVREVLSDLEVKIEEINAEINIGELPAIDADATQMRQLFQNLIGNGLKFRKPETAPIIKISAEKNDENPTKEFPKGFCRITVEDNGIGFEEKYLDRIFTVFQRLHGRQEYEGSGIGLAVCRKIVERHNGVLTAQSELGKGAKFIFTLPFEQTEGDQIHETEC